MHFCTTLVGCLLLQGQFVLSTGDSRYEGQPVAVQEPSSSPGIPGDRGLVLTQPARHYAVTAPIVPAIALSRDDGDADAPFPLVVQYEVRLQEGLTCGGAYIKLYEAGPAFSPSSVTGSTPYVLMFGPDRCGGTDKVHLIARYRSPVTGLVEEKHLLQPPRTKSDKLSHLYTLVIKADGTYDVRIDGVSARAGNLSGADFEPPFLPPPTIPDPSDVKPDDWVDEPDMDDVTAVKPSDWDEDAPMTIPDEDAVKPAGWLEGEPDSIPDPSAEKPRDWDEEEDGEWEAPRIPNPACDAAPGCGPWVRPLKRNPAYRGPWVRPRVPNPAYKGAWAPRRIPNPEAFTDDALHKIGGAAIGGIGTEVWTMSGGILLDNVLVTRDEGAAQAFANATWAVKHAAEEAAVAAAERAAAKAERRAAASSGTWVERALFWVGEMGDEAHAVLGSRGLYALAACALLSLLLTTYAACCARPAAAGGAVGKGHGHGGSHGHSHDGGDSGDDEQSSPEDEDDDAQGPTLAAPAQQQQQREQKLGEPECEGAAEDEAAAPAAEEAEAVTAAKGVRRRPKRA